VKILVGISGSLLLIERWFNEIKLAWLQVSQEKKQFACFI